jgi:glutamine synthetase
MMWLTKNEDGTPTGKGFSKPYCYHIDQFEVFKTSVHASYEICKSDGS